MIKRKQRDASRERLCSSQSLTDLSKSIDQAPLVAHQPVYGRKKGLDKLNKVELRKSEPNLLFIGYNATDVENEDDLLGVDQPATSYSDYSPSSERIKNLSRSVDEELDTYDDTVSELRRVRARETIMVKLRSLETLNKLDLTSNFQSATELKHAHSNTSLLSLQ